jgi:homoserine kinase
MNRTSFRIPASTANLGPGFDAMGLALGLYLRITLEPSNTLQIEVTGTDAEEIPVTTDNLIYQVAKTTAAKRARKLPPFRMLIDNEIPLTRGLGSSASAVIAGITCYEILTGDKLNEQDLFACAWEFEDHPDNLSASLYGGLVTAAATDAGTVWAAKLKIPGDLAAVVVIPTFELPTEKARFVLPQTYSRQDVVYNIQRVALTVAALTTCDRPLIREAMRDRVHQPYREKLIPGLEEILSLECEGLLGVALSGAGPTVFAFADPGKATEIGQRLVATYGKHGVKAESLLLEIDKTGRVIDPS